MNKLDIKQYKKIVILTGAGVSAASGIKPFRGAEARFEDWNAITRSSAELLDTDPGAVWQLYGSMRTEAALAKPNPAHYALAKLENSMPPGAGFTLITQNIDRLHEAAGSKNIVKLHGDAFVTRCSNQDCDLEPFEDFNSYEDTEVPRCPNCGSVLRPGIVLFNERIPVDEQWLSKQALRDCDLFIAIGTSGTVAPASYFVRSADYEGARTVFVNLTEMDPVNPYFKESVIGKAEDILPELFGVSLLDDERSKEHE